MNPNNTNTTGSRRRTDHAPDPDLMDWTGENLPDPQNYFLTDLDLVVRDRQGRLMILEIKRRNADVDGHQRATLELIDHLIREGLKANPDGIKIPSMRYPIKVDYRGLHLLQFERTTFEDGQIFWDRQPVTVDQVIDLFSFRSADCTAQPQTEP